MPRKPTTKQLKAIELAVENHGNVSAAMREAGYSPATAKNPKNLTETDIWRELVESKLPDQDLVDAHAEGLKAMRVVSARITTSDAGSQTDDFIEVPDYPTRHKYLETAYKLKRRLGPENFTNIQNNQFAVFDGGETTYAESPARTD